MACGSVSRAGHFLVVWTGRSAWRRLELKRQFGPDHAPVTAAPLNSAGVSSNSTSLPSMPFRGTLPGYDRGPVRHLDQSALGGCPIAWALTMAVTFASG